MPTEDERFDGMLEKRDKAERRGDERRAERLDQKIPTHAAVRADRRDREAARMAKVAIWLAIAALIVSLSALAFSVLTWCLSK